MSDLSQAQPAVYGPGLPPASGWKLTMREDPTEYSPEFQDEYRRLWHEAAAARDKLIAAGRAAIEATDAELNRALSELDAVISAVAR